MQIDFHYYATYCAAYLAGYSHDESVDIGYSSQFTDMCSKSFLLGIGAPASAATTQLTFEMADTRADIIGLQSITRIWSSFHFLPRDLYAEVKKGSKRYRQKYRLICGPNGDLIEKTVALAKDKSLQAAGIAMHVMADTWAHRYFAGTPSLVINNTSRYFYEILPDGSERQIIFTRSAGTDEPETGKYTASIYQPGENSIMNLGHGRAGHLPDYSYIKYKYLPAWGSYEEIVKDNQSDYFNAFSQMVYALKTLRDPDAVFEKDHYDTESVGMWEERIKEILAIRQIDSCADWKALAKEISGEEIPDFDADKYRSEYMEADDDAKNDTFLGRYVKAALAQKSMVTGNIFESGNRTAGFSVELKNGRFRGMRDFRLLAEDVLSAAGGTVEGTVIEAGEIETEVMKDE